MKQSILIILFFYLLLIFQNFNAIFAQNPNFDSLANEVNKLSHYKKTAALELLDSLYLLAYYSPDSAEFIARCLYEEALLKNRHKIVDTLLEHRILNRLDKEDIPLQEQALLFSALSLNLMKCEKYSKALEKYKLIQNKLFISKAFKGLENFRPLKIEMLRSENLDEIESIFEKIK
jgi:hypothetical protein